MNSDPDYIVEFVRAIYPDYAELAMASFNERAIITDATEALLEARERIEGWEAFARDLSTLNHEQIRNRIAALLHKRSET